MTKILLVEDDKSLREIYGVRLLAEGYEIVSAGDGEEAIAIAVKERPTMIISDVMMPKISGFDLLDLIRSTPELKDVKVIMMTALSSEEQRERGVRLGADRYLVKSQVGIEDVVRTVHEVLADSATALSDAQVTHAENVAADPTATVPSEAPVSHVAAAPANIFTSDDAPFVQPVAPQQSAEQPMTVPQQAAPVASEPTVTHVPIQDAPTQAPIAPAPSFPPAQTVPGSAPAGTLPQPTPTRGERKLEPLTNFSNPAVDLSALVDKEIARETAAVEQLPVATTNQELTDLQSQVQQFEQIETPTVPELSAAPVPAPVTTPEPQPAAAAFTPQEAPVVTTTQPQTTETLQPTTAAAPSVPVQAAQPVQTVQPQPVAQPVQPTSTTQPPTIQL